MYVRKTYYFDDGIEVEEYHSARYGAPGEKRRKKEKPTSAAVKRQNMLKRIRDIRHLIRWNFKNDDYWITLTYRQDARPKDMADAKKDVERLIRKLRPLYKRAGIPFRWMKKTEIGSRGGIHHHLLINRIPEIDRTLQQKWPHGRAHYCLTYTEGGYAKLAEYIAKDEGKQTDFSRSRNMIVRKPKTQIMRRRTMEKEPRPRKGYVIDKNSLVEGVNPLGYPFRHYAMFRKKKSG